MIGQDCWERDESAVPPFIKKMGDKMTYRVALDLKTGASDRGRMAETWMAAAGRNGIPSAFVVNKKGLIAWIGHPMSLKESMLEQIISGTYDIAKAAIAADEQKRLQPQLTALSRQLSQNMQQKKWDEASTALSELEKIMPEESRGNLDLTRFRIHMGRGDHAAAYKMARATSDSQRDNAMLQNFFAWEIVKLDAAAKPDLELAELLATRANEAAKGENSAILDTLARVHFRKGNSARAIELQAKAVSLADTRSKPHLEEVLKSYREGKLPPAGN